MAEVIFFEKPGCANNTRQKKLLQEAGHCVVSRNLLQEAWTEDRLLEFFKGMPVAEWFNTSAPRVKSGELVPAELDTASALRFMLDEPLLIRRPLLQCNGTTMVGFDFTQVNNWIGLIADTFDSNLEQCRKK